MSASHEEVGSNDRNNNEPPKEKQTPKPQNPIDLGLFFV